jgi:hypothetical protein
VTPLRGPLFALLAAALFGLSPPLAKPLIGQSNPRLLAGLLFLGALSAAIGFGEKLSAQIRLAGVWIPLTESREETGRALREMRQAHGMTRTLISARRRADSPCRDEFDPFRAVRHLRPAARQRRVLDG